MPNSGRADEEEDEDEGEVVVELVCGLLADTDSLEEDGSWSSGGGGAGARGAFQTELRLGRFGARLRSGGGRRRAPTRSRLAGRCSAFASERWPRNAGSNSCLPVRRRSSCSGWGRGWCRWALEWERQLPSGLGRGDGRRRRPRRRRGRSRRWPGRQPRRHRRRRRLARRRWSLSRCSDRRPGRPCATAPPCGAVAPAAPSRAPSRTASTPPGSFQPPPRISGQRHPGGEADLRAQRVEVVGQDRAQALKRRLVVAVRARLRPAQLAPGGEDVEALEVGQLQELSSLAERKPIARCRRSQRSWSSAWSSGPGVAASAR